MSTFNALISFNDLSRDTSSRRSLPEFRFLLTSVTFSIEDGEGMIIPPIEEIVSVGLRSVGNKEILILDYNNYRELI